MSAALELVGVSKRRGAGAHAVQAVKDVSLSLDSGELVLLQGPSGSGKTTLLALAAGLLRADAGEVRLGGAPMPADVAGRRTVRARAVGFVFQGGNLLPRLTVRENVCLPALLVGLSAADAAPKADALLDRLGLGSLASRWPADLSGGEEQRVAIARALVHAPALVLADEPTASLDGHAGTAVAETLRVLARERRTAVLVATHDARLVPYADRCLQLVDGRLDSQELRHA